MILDDPDDPVKLVVLSSRLMPYFRWYVYDVIKAGCRPRGEK